MTVLFNFVLLFQSDTDDDDQWDDKKLNTAYDKAVKIANIEVAKRVAMSTNTPNAKIDRNVDRTYIVLSRRVSEGKVCLGLISWHRHVILQTLLKLFAPELLIKIKGFDIYTMRMR